MKSKFIVTTFILTAFTAPAFADTNGMSIDADNGFTQSVEMINLLANTSISNPGMTPTQIIAQYYNGGSSPCWTYTLNYQQDYTIHAGPTQGCVNNVNKITITPVVVAGLLKTYTGPYEINIDTTKYSTQIMIIQNQAPTFDTQSGLVVNPGSITAKIQSQVQ